MLDTKRVAGVVTHEVWHYIQWQSGVREFRLGHEAEAHRIQGKIDKRHYGADYKETIVDGKVVRQGLTDWGLMYVLRTNTGYGHMANDPIKRRRTRRIVDPTTIAGAI